MVKRTLDSLERLFDRLSEARHDLRSVRIVVGLALLGLGLHAGLVFLANHLDTPPPLISAVGRDYLSALYTPFSFILFYEVLLLILSLPESTSLSLGKQYEILSLIVVRNVFKDIAEFESVTELADEVEEFSAILLDAGGGLLMFLLVALFYRINSRRRPLALDDGARDRVRTFVRRKKFIALALSGLLFVLAAINLAAWCTDVFAVAERGAAPTIDIKKIFYLDLFNVRAAAVHGHTLDPGQLLTAVAYGLCFTGLLLALSDLTFRRREFK